MKNTSLPPGEWSPCPDGPDLFLVSRKGELYSLRSNKIVSQNPVGAGYLAHITKVGGRNGKTLVLKAHIQVAKAFHPNPDNLPEVNHKNGIKTCNEDWNVEWSTHQDNIIHAFETGLMTNDHTKSVKLSGADIREIIENEHGSSREIGRKYGVDHTVILNIRKNPARYLSATLKKQ